MNSCPIDDDAASMFGFPRQILKLTRIATHLSLAVLTVAILREFSISTSLPCGACVFRPKAAS